MVPPFHPLPSLPPSLPPSLHSQELWQCYEDMQASVVKTPRSRRSRAVGGEGVEGEGVEGVGWVEVVVDLLLGVMSQPSQLWRSVATQVFRMITPQITGPALQLILKVSPCLWCSLPLLSGARGVLCCEEFFFCQVLELQDKEELMKSDGEGEEEEERRRRRRRRRRKRRRRRRRR